MVPDQSINPPADPDLQTKQSRDILPPKEKPLQYLGLFITPAYSHKDAQIF